MPRMPILTPIEVCGRIIECISELRLILKKYNSTILSIIDPLLSEYDKSEWSRFWIKDLHQRSLRDIFGKIFALRCYINECEYISVRKFIDVSEFSKDMISAIDELWISIKDYPRSRFIDELDKWCDRILDITINDYINLGDSLGELIDSIPNAMDMIESNILSLRVNEVKVRELHGL